MIAGTCWRIVFGISAILCGIVGLLWHDSDVWQHALPVGVALTPIVVWLLTIAQVVGGLALLVPRTVRSGAIIIAVVYVLFTLACTPGIVLAPATYGSYVDFFELLSVACGAFAVFAATASSAAQSAQIGRVVRLGFGICTISFAWAQVAYFQYTASLVPVGIPPNPTFWTVLTTVAFALAAAAILIGVQARLALRLVTVMVALFGLLVWVPRIAAQPSLSNWNEIGLNFLIASAAWLVADLKSF
jgi:uncharacterized membrane protein YphA (DoxX/SURF4 family)